MEIIAGFSWWQNMLLVAVGLFVLVSILALPRATLVESMKYGGAGYSGVMLPINGVTLGVGGLLGAPGIMALGLAAYVI